MGEFDLQTLCDQSGVHRMLEVRIERSGDGVALRARAGEEFAADASSPALHGGIVATLLDTAATFALIARTESDWVTVDLRVDYLRPAGTGALTLSGEVVRAGRSVGRARSTLTDERGNVCAIAIGTFAPAGGTPRS